MAINNGYKYPDPLDEWTTNTLKWNICLALCKPLELMFIALKPTQYRISFHSQAIRLSSRSHQNPLWVWDLKLDNSPVLRRKSNIEWVLDWSLPAQSDNWHWVRYITVATWQWHRSASCRSMGRLRRIYLASGQGNRIYWLKKQGPSSSGVWWSNEMTVQLAAFPHRHPATKKWPMYTLAPGQKLKSLDWLSLISQSDRRMGRQAGDL